MRNSARCLLVVLLAPLASPPLLAQTTGEMKGAVVDATGAPLPGVSIEARSAALQAFRAATTNAVGEFRLPVLPPGVYAVSARLEGFKPGEQSSIRVRLGETVTAPTFTLLLVLNTETTVSGEVPLVDTTSTRIGISMPALMLTELPLGRNFSDVMVTLAGSGKDYARCNCDPSKTAGNTIFGATSLENNYVIDGLNTTGVLEGDQGKQLNLEFVQEVEVRTGGYEAEYGKAMGASLNVITKSGGNEFHGGVFGYYDSASLASSNQHTDEQNALSLTRVDPPTRYDLGLDLGGYVLKDTLWFFGAFDRVANDADYQRVDSLTYTPTSVIPNYVPGTEVRRTSLFSAKLTLRAGPSHTFVASVFGDPNTYDGRTGVSGPASAALIRKENGGTDVVARWDGVFGTQFLGQAQYGYHEEGNSTLSDYSDRVRFMDVRRGFAQAAPGSGPGGGIGPGTLRRNSWGATATAYLGNHDLKAGVGYEHQNSSQTTYWSGGGQVIRYRTFAGSFDFAQHVGFGKAPLNCQVKTDGSVGNFGFVDPTTCNGWEPAVASDTSPRTQNLALFLQDSWKILPNLTVNAGIRYEDQRATQGQLNLDLTNQWSPRVGVVWDPLANGRSKVFASYGRYYQVIPQEIQIAAMAAEPWLYAFNYTENRLDLVADNNVAPYEYASGSAYIPPGLKGMYQDEVVAGVEAEVWRNWSLGIKGIYRSLGRLLEDRCDVYDPRSGLAGSIPPEALSQCVMMNPGEGQFGQLSDPANPDCWEDYPKSTVPKPCESVRASRVFRGLQLDVRHNFSDRFYLQASYLYSRLVGNYDGFVNQLYGTVNPGINPDFDNPDTLVNAYGRLSLGRTHQAKLTGFYVSSFGLHAGVNASFATGAPLSILGTAANGARLYLQERGSWDQLPSAYNVDLHLEYPLRLGPVTLVPLLDVFNVTNVQPAIQRGQVYNGVPGANLKPPYTKPTVATFGQDTAWQSPRVVRLGARVSF
jgi:outer membrane receptor protein involved in Fe transport